MLGNDKVVETVSTGGFPLDVEFSATRLRELAKMDGGIVCDREVTRILRAATQLVPDPRIETSESGTRHRTAERVAKQTGFPVVSVSQSMRIIALYVAGRRVVLEDSSAILSRANQALQTLERYKSRLDEVTGTLSALEIEDLVTVRDVANVLQRLEMVRRIKDEIAEYVVQLGTDGRLLSLQLEELTGGLSDDLGLVIRDYLPEAKAGLHASRRPSPTSRPSTPPSCSTPRPGPGRSASRSSATRSTPRSARSATGCCPRCRACRGPSSTGSSGTSAASRSCSPPTSTTSWTSTASARAAPGWCARACRAWPSRASSSATSDPPPSP